MSTPTNSNSVESARAALPALRSTLIDAINSAAVADQALTDAQRTTADPSPETGNASTADAALVTARTAFDSGVKALNDQIGAWLTDTATKVPITPAADVGRMTSLNPIVFFPVRIETRFEGTNLKVRVYPDEIFFNSHETALTPDEQAAGKNYYNNLNQPGAKIQGQQDDWRDMVKSFGAPRSAYILRAMLPTNFVETTEPTAAAPPTVPMGTNATLTFPSVQTRPRAFTRPAEAILPDRWVVMTRRGNTRKLTTGSPISEPLPVTVDPAPSAKQSQLPNGYTVDDRTRWTIDYDAAVSVGMAVTVPLSADDARLGFDRVVVFGVKSSMAVLETLVMLTQLVDAHHYTRGVAFLQQEAATNNTQTRRTTVPLDDDAGQASFAIERAIPPLRPPGNWRFSLLPDNADETKPLVDGNFWSLYMGVFPGAVQNVDRALEHEIVRAHAMNRALWPVTYGSFLKFMMDPVISGAGIKSAKNFFVDANGPGGLNYDGVTARGVAPAIRIGQVPYGLLPVAALQGWQTQTLFDSSDAQAVAAKLLDPLKRLFQIWLAASPGVARVAPQSSQPDVDLLHTLSLFSASRNARLRNGYGEFFLYDLFSLLAWDIAPGFTAFDKATSDLFQRLGHPEWRPRIGRTLFFKDAPFVTTPFVDLDKNLSESQGLASDYVVGLINASGADLISNAGKPSQDSLLYELLRIATLTEYALQLDASLLANPPSGGYSAWTNAEVFALANLPVSSVISLLLVALNTTTAKGLASLHLQALSNLVGTPTAELDRLARETLDLASHRLDVWVTAFAANRVVGQRSQEGGFGSYLGGYAWVENLRPLARTTVTGPDGNPAEVDSTNGGFIHSPSSQHAMAAAVLRSGFMSMNGDDPQKYAFDLSSRQVRSGIQTLEEVAAGRHLGEVLGYRFERGLQEDHPGVPNLNQQRFNFRNLFPLVAGKDGVDTPSAPDKAAAPNLVDGLALYRAYKLGTINFASPLPLPGTSQYKAVIAELNNLGQMLDGVADLMVAEGVYQLAGGNVTGAASSLDNLVRGGRPPEPGIAKSPRSGRGLTHRVMYLFQAEALPQLPAKWGPATPRALAEPLLNAWVGSLIGDPTNVTATVNYTAGGLPKSASVDPAKVGLHPLDLLALASASLQPNQASLLEQRILAVVTDVAGNTGATIDYGPAAGRDVTKSRTFPEIVEFLVTLGAALGGSRALLLDDLLAPSDLTATLPAVESTALTNANEVLDRAKAASSGLDGVAGPLATSLAALKLNQSDTTAQTNVFNAIRACVSYAPERAWANPSDSASTLIDTASALSQELGRRQAAVATAKPASGAASADVVQGATAMLQAIFGANLLVLPQVTPPGSAELNQSLGARTTLLGGSDAAPLSQFLQQAMHGRAQLGRYRKFSLYARALGSAAPGLNLVQLPFVPGEQWLGRTFPDTLDLDASRTSLILLSQASPLDPTKLWSGIVLESWTEIIPGRKQQTSIAFNYNGPRAEAPQSILVMAPSQGGANWVVDDIVASLEQTMDLAKVRAVDRDLLGDLGQLIPGIVLPTNTNPNITTSSGLVAAIAHLTAAAKVGFQ